MSESPEKKVKSLQRQYHINRIRREFYGRISRETKEEHLTPDELSFFEWFAKEGHENGMIVVVRSRNMIWRMRRSWAMFVALNKFNKFSSTTVDRAKTIINGLRSFNADDRDPTWFGTPVLILHDCELFTDKPEPLSEVLRERFNSNKSTVLVGSETNVTEDALDIVQHGYTKIEDGIIENQHSNYRRKYVERDQKS